MMQKSIRFFCLLLIGALLFSGCSSGQTASADVYILSEDREFLSHTSTETELSEHSPSEFVKATLQVNPSLLPEKTEVLDATVEGDTLTVNFSAPFRTIEEENFLYLNELVALGVTKNDKTLNSAITRVNLLCEGEELPFCSYPYICCFIDQIDGEQIPTWSLHLYFWDNAAKKLVREYRLTQQQEDALGLIMDEFRRGTKDPARKTGLLPESVQMNSAREENGTCLIDLSQELLTDCPEDRQELLLQALVACYTEFDTIDCVKFSINGQDNMTFGGKALSEPIVPDPSFFDDPELYFAPKEEITAEERREKQKKEVRKRGTELLN